MFVIYEDLDQGLVEDVVEILMEVLV